MCFSINYKGSIKMGLKEYMKMHKKTSKTYQAADKAIDENFTYTFENGEKIVLNNLQIRALITARLNQLESSSKHIVNYLKTGYVDNPKDTSNSITDNINLKDSKRLTTIELTLEKIIQLGLTDCLTDENIIFELEDSILNQVYRKLSFDLKGNIQGFGRNEITLSCKPEKISYNKRILEKYDYTEIELKDYKDLEEILLIAKK